ncbi:MAG TPA: DegV family protein [Firmicutes bacterium]|jgi:DegV family protein with EDD domain|nr:DegV family protein [Bacillota bacterium]
MNKVKIITDTACDLTMDYLTAQGIGVVPMTINFPDCSYRDGFDLSRDEFYRLLVAADKLPTTAQPTPGDFLQVLQKVLADGDEAVVITISSAMSGTYESALLAREQVEQKEKVAVFDSRTASLGQGLLVIKAQELAAAGLGKNEIIKALTKIRTRLCSVFTLDTLEYLQKGGRVNRVQAVMGDVLNIKPILQVDKEGRIVPREKVRGRRRAIKRLLEIMAAEGRELFNQLVTVGHSRCEEEAVAFAEELKKLYNVKEVRIGEISSTVGTHTGPGCLVVFFQGERPC